MTVATGDLWRVRIAPGEEKVLTLEQVDDLFRLEMIDENTLLWQEGMDEWLPLKVVAGLDEDEAEPSTQQLPPPAGLVPPTELPRPPAPPPPPAALPPPPKSLRPPDGAPVHRDTLMPGWTAAPAVRSEPPPPPSARRAPTPPPPPVQSAPPPMRSAPPPIGSAPPPMRSAPPPLGSAPPPLGSKPPPLSNPPPPSLDAPALPNFAPMAVPQLAAPARASRLESVLIGLAVLAGVVVTLHRNGVLHALSPSFDGVEAALGGPGLGTPRAVEALVAKTPQVASKP